MTDKEMLELAAKAAGYELIRWNNALGFVIRNADGYPQKWNPLAQDGDALRLAIKLGICIVFMEDHDSVGAEHSRHGVMIIEAMDDLGTRRAIVRAAAQIGSTLP